MNYQKYQPFKPINLIDRQWPSKTIKNAPIWCSVDLRDGNQALVNPMNFEQKLAYFKLLCDIGFKEIEIGFPSASQTEYEILRALIERNLIPDDVFVQVLVQSRRHLIEKTFESIKGAKNVIVHFYNSTSTLQRRVVFNSDMAGVTKIAVEAAEIIAQLGEKARSEGTNIRYEYSPESFTGTELDFAVDITSKVMKAMNLKDDEKMIINLPATVEMSTPNCYADQIEYFCKHLPDREHAIISLHPHNDRGTAIAAAELGMMAGADRIEGTLFGNGERTGNLDIMTMALNMHTQGIDCKLDLSDIPHLKSVYEESTSMKIHERHPYAGQLVFTAFSGSHQDAINKGLHALKKSASNMWEVPYLPIDPADIGREYEPIIRINSQSGKGGAAFIMESVFGFILPKSMHPEFGAIVKAKCDKTGRELTNNEIGELFSSEYININSPYTLVKYNMRDESIESGSKVYFSGIIKNGGEHEVSAYGNGPIDAFFNAVRGIGIDNYEFVSYHEHADSSGSDAKAIAYIELKKPDGQSIFGVGIDANINIASILAVLSAINRAKKA